MLLAVSIVDMAPIDEVVDYGRKLLQSDNFSFKSLDSWSNCFQHGFLMTAFEQLFHNFAFLSVLLMNCHFRTCVGCG